MNNEQCIDGCLLFVDQICQITILVQKICFVIYSQIMRSKLKCSAYIVIGCYFTHVITRAFSIKCFSPKNYGYIDWVT